MPDCEPDNDFDDDDHTKIGPAHELAAQSMMVPDELANVPPPSRNVVRRTGAMPAVRGSGVMPQVRAEGSLTEMRMDGPTAELDRERDELGAVQAVEIFDDEPSISVVIPAAPVVTPAPPAPARRIGVIAWSVTVAVAVALLIGGGTYGYLRIAELEQRVTTAERDAADARARAAEATRRLATKPAKAPPVTRTATCTTSTTPSVQLLAAP